MLRMDCEALAGKSMLNRLEHTPRHGRYVPVDGLGQPYMPIDWRPYQAATRRQPYRHDKGTQA